MDKTRHATRRIDPSPSLAAFLSFLWPGLGQLYVGRPWLAAAFAVPMLAVALFAVSQVAGGADVLAIRLFAPAFALGLLFTVGLAAVWRLASMAHAFGFAGVRAGVSPWRETSHLRWLAVMAVVVAVTHGLVAYGAWSFYEAGTRIFVTAPVRPTATDPGTATQPSAEPSMPTPYETPATASARINILLIGSDGGLGYSHSLTDSMIVVSADPSTKQVVMLSFPRDIAQFQLYGGGTFAGKLNSLVGYATAHPQQFPDGGLGTLTREIGHLLGVPIHYYAYVNLSGFKKLVDTVGGVDVVVQKPIRDPTYQFPDGKVGFVLTAGPHHLDGRQALAFVRSRQGVGDNDFTRAARQQQLLVALRAELTDPGMLPKLPSVLDALSSTIQTDFPVDRLGDMLTLAKEVADGTVGHYVLGPPYATHPPTDQTGGTYILRLDMRRISKLSVTLFGEDSRYYAAADASPSPSGSP